MQWLNKVDDALDWVLGSAPPNTDTEEAERSSGIQVDGNSAARLRPTRRSDYDNSTNAVDSDNFDTANERVLQGPVDIAIHHGGIAINDAAAGNATTTFKPQRPPPPPPPSAANRTTTTTTRNAHPLSSSSSLPSDTSHFTPPTTILSNVTENSPLLLQIQDFAKASPAPSKVVIGDRQPLTESLLKLKVPNLDSQQHSKHEHEHEYGYDRDDNQKLTSHLPPPTTTTTSWSTLNQTEKHIVGNPTSQWGQQPIYSQRNNARYEPPSPSTLVIHLPTTQQDEQLQLPPPLPLPLSRINNQIPPPPTGHIPQRTTTATARAPLVVTATARTTTSTTSTSSLRATPRPIPGVIRRKLREPSLSPPDSPSQSTSSSLQDEMADGDGKLNSLVIDSSTQQHTLTEDRPDHNNRIDTSMTVVDWFKGIGSRDDGEGRRGGVNKIHADHNNEDHDDASFSNGSFHSHTSTDSELTESNMLDDFALPSPSSSSPEDVDIANQSRDPSLNCYGFFHLRLLRAQRLPCPSGSSINATISLQPWKGRIRVPALSTIEGPEGAGVCLRWDKRFDPKRGVGGDRSGNKAGDKDPCSHSMVHAYNNEDTPIPTIVVELSITSLGGVFDRYLCSIAIPCHDLMKNPRSWRHKWHPGSLIQGEGARFDSDNIDNAPLILLETCFEPMTTRVNPEQVTADISDDVDTVNVSGDTDTLGSIPNMIGPAQHHHRRRGGSLIDDDSTSKSSTLTPALVPRSSSISKAHLLRVRSFWTPTWCAVCSQSILSGWMKGKSYECEECHIFCCRDCHLQVDARIPCGSELAAIAVKKAQQYQLPSLGQIMSTLAPDLGGRNDTGVSDSTLNNGENTSSNMNSTPNHTEGSIQGIGVMHVKVLRACLFDKTFPPEAEPNVIFESDSNLHNGDHYVRVSWLGSKESKRTKTVLQTPKPFFDSDVMVFDVPHYGMEYKLEVVDANTDKPIGSCLLSTQFLLQWQRDDMFAQPDRILLSLLHLRKYSEPRRVKLELRTGVKDGFGLNFYNSSEVVGGSTNKGKSTAQRPGEISGWLEIDVRLEEDRSLFYSMNPRRCPPKGDEEFDIALIQLHIARITAITEFVQNLAFAYLHVVSWENPQVTGMSMICFVFVTLRMNLEYLGALPIGCLVMFMIYLGFLRINGHFKDRWTMQEKEAVIKAETKIEINQTIFRPMGLLHVGELQGKNLRSRDLGLPGSFYACIMYDPLRYADDKTKSSQTKIDSSSGCVHQIGATVSPGITSNPTWTHVQDSAELMRLKHLLPDDRIWRKEKDINTSLSYPILQPVTGVTSGDGTGISLLPWEQSYGAIVIQVRFNDVLGSFSLFDNVIGEVVIPLAKLAGSGRAVEGWFRLLGVGTTDTIPGAPPVTLEENTDELTYNADVGHADISSVAFPELHVKVKFSSKSGLADDMCSSDDMESFKVICEEISRTASTAQENSIGMIGSSLNTINTVRTLGGQLQNQLSYVVDMLERVRNAFNFSNPRITVFILLCLIILWIFLALIPTRILVLFGGMAQFGATYYAKYMAQPAKITPDHKDNIKDESEEANTGNPLENLFLSIPTDADLRRIYFWEARRAGEKERERFAQAKRQTRLEKLWKSKWHGALKLKEKRSESTVPFSSRNWNWTPVFGLIEGHRFIWWRSERHFDVGDAPLGQIFFAGHSGLAGLSPLDLRELSNEEIPFVVSIFGRSALGQLKVTFLASSLDVKDSLESTVIQTSMDAKSD